MWICAILLAVAPEARAVDVGTSTTAFRFIDRVVARVNSTVITYSELRGEARLALVEAGDVEAARRAPLTEDLLDAALRRMIERELLRAEATRLGIAEMDGSEANRTIEALSQSFRSRHEFLEFLADAGFSDAAIGSAPDAAWPASFVSHVRAERQVELFLNLRGRVAIRVDDADISRCFQARRDRFPGRDLASVRGVLARHLRRDRERALYRGLIRDLEARATVRHAPEFASSADKREVDGDEPFCPE